MTFEMKTVFTWTPEELDAYVAKHTDQDGNPLPSFHEGLTYGHHIHNGEIVITMGLK